MKKQKYAVITGDMVDSTQITANYQEVLRSIAQDIDRYLAPGSLFDIFRGDSFQMLIPVPKQALLAGLLFRIGIRRHSNGPGLEKIWDARVSIGIGAVNDVSISKKTSLGTLEGEAFIRSGRTLDVMKMEGAFLKITTGQPAHDEHFGVCTSLADAIIGRWTTAQSQALYLYLLQGLTQKEIGDRLKVSQRAIGQRFESAQFPNLQPFLQYFKKSI